MMTSLKFSLLFFGGVLLAAVSGQNIQNLEGNPSVVRGGTIILQVIVNTDYNQAIWYSGQGEVSDRTRYSVVGRSHRLTITNAQDSDTGTYYYLLDGGKTYFSGTLSVTDEAERYSNWGQWTVETSCSVTCGKGSETLIRRRSCLSGSCSGNLQERKQNPCERSQCPVAPEGVPVDLVPGVTALRGQSVILAVTVPTITSAGSWYSSRGIILTSGRFRKWTDAYSHRLTITNIELSDEGTYFYLVDSYNFQGNLTVVESTTGATYGQWSAYQKISLCSRTCGNGVLTEERTRSCLSGTCSQVNLRETRQVSCNLRTCDCVGDFTIYIVLDGSESFGLENFQTAKNSLNNFVVDNLGRNPNNRIGVIVYSDKVTENITATSNRVQLQAAINSISYPNGGTATQFGIASATAHLLEDPFENTKIMIVITDGLSGQPLLTAAAAEFAKRKGITTFAVGLTATVVDFEDHLQQFNAELRSIASNNTEIYTIDNFSGLSAILANVSRSLCSLDVNIVNPMKDRTVLEGSNVRMSTTLNQAGITDGRWTFEDRSLSSTTRYNTRTAGRLQYLDITGVRLSDGGSYSYAYNTAGSGAVLTVLGLMANQTARVGDTTIFQTRVSPSTTEGMWLKNGAPLNTLDDKYTVEVLGGGFQRLIINDVDASDAGRYAYVINGVETSAFLELSAIDGGWSDYGEWQPDPLCLEPCGLTRRKWTRQRQCNNPVPTPGGKPCSGEAIEESTRPCENSPVCPVNRMWGEWEAWRELCNAQPCGTFPGRRVRQRQCDNPAPKEFGDFCQGEAFESEGFVCNRLVKIMNCSFGDPVAPNKGTPQNLTSGVTAVKGRTVIIQAPMRGSAQGDWYGPRGRITETDGGRFSIAVVGGSNHLTIRNVEDGDAGIYYYIPPSGSFSQGTLTVDDSGPTYGRWGSWREISTCTRSCGNGVLTEDRTRSCLSGTCSQADLRETRQVNCNLRTCAIDGGWSDYGEWQPDSSCLVTCGPTTRRWTRQRECNNPVPSPGGQPCSGEAIEATTRPCANSPDCPVNGMWGEWEAWRELCNTQTCGTFPGRRVRQRQCDNPAPNEFGDFCQGEAFESEGFVCNRTECDVDGEWGAWTNWATSDCQSTCGEGVRVRTRDRLCDSPAPKGNGFPCFGDGNERGTETCYNKPCPSSTYGPWGNWVDISSCSVTCGYGEKNQRRSRSCLSGTCSVLQESQTSRCFEQSCPGDNNKLCESAEQHNGIGYRYHPTDCNKYIQCYTVGDGTTFVMFRTCPFGKFWNQGLFKCENSYGVKCPIDKCKDDCRASYKVAGSCGAYVQCYEDKSEFQCCPRSYMYVPGKGCRFNLQCDEFCNNPWVNNNHCMRRPVDNVPNRFRMFAGDLGWQASTCPGNSVFDLLSCECKTKDSACNPSYSVTFRTQQSLITRNIQFGNSMATFQRNSRLTLKVTAQERSYPVGMKFRYRETAVNSEWRVLVTNDNCNQKVNLKIALDEDNELQIHLTTWYGDVNILTLSTQGMEDWKTVTLGYDGFSLRAQVQSGDQVVMGELVGQRSGGMTGILECGVSMGAGDDSGDDDGFIGDVNMLSLYNCDPTMP